MKAAFLCEFATIRNALAQMAIIYLIIGVVVGIAMENATVLCREAADYVTLSHEKDGVAWGIRKILGL